MARRFVKAIVVTVEGLICGPVEENSPAQ